MNNEKMMGALALLPDPELLQAGKITDPLGSDAFYSARTVVKLLEKQRKKMLPPESRLRLASILEDAHSELQWWKAQDLDELACVTASLRRLDDALDILRKQ